MEALIGASYVCAGLETTREFVYRLVGDGLENEQTLGAAKDFKTSVQEFAASSGSGPAHYAVTSVGPDHARSYTATLHVGDREYASGTGKSKKVAEKLAAQASWPLIEAELAEASSASGYDAGASVAQKTCGARDDPAGPKSSSSGAIEETSGGAVGA